MGTVQVDGNIFPIECDVTSKKSLVAAVEQVRSGVGFVNVLIANAGVSGPLLDLPKNPELADWQKELFNVPMEDFSKTSEVNVTAAFYSMLAFLPLLDAGNAKKNVEQKSQVILTSSIAGFIREVPSSFSYGVSKAAATHLMKSVATTFAPWHIRANVIAPGVYESEMTEDWFKGVENATKDGAFPQDFIPLTRAGGEEDIAGVVLFLCSKAGGYVNGNVVVTDGGILSFRPATY